MPKRIGNIFEEKLKFDKMLRAYKRASKEKHENKEVVLFKMNLATNITNMLLDIYKDRYVIGNYRKFKIYEPKERLIYRLPYYPDRIVHHAIMNIMEPIWKSVFIKQTYSSIKNRGIHACAKDVRFALDNFPEETKYCLKLDIHKFYPSIDHEILKKIIRIKIKDNRLLKLLDDIIDSAPGVPIGNYLS